MRKLIVILLILTSFSSKAEHKLEGTWVGYKQQINSFNSHVLEINEHGNGFYAFTLSSGLNEEYVITINKDNLSFNNGVYTLATTLNNEVNVTVIFADNLISKLSVLTVVTSADKSVAFSFAWDLVKANDYMQNKTLYLFAKEQYNKSLQQDK